MFVMAENRLFAYADDSTLLAVVRKPAGRPADAASLNRYFDRIQEWCKHWCMILNPNKIKALVGPGLLALPVVTWSCPGLISELVPTSTSLSWSLTASSPSKTMCVILFPASLRELVFWGWWNVYLWTPLCYFVAILHLFSQSLSFVLRCGGQLLNVIFSFMSARRIWWPGFVPIRVFVDVSSASCAKISILYKVNSNSYRCLFSELPSASSRVRHTRDAAAAHPLEFEASRCRTTSFARSFLPAQVRLWNDLPYTVFDTGTLDGFKGAVNPWLLVFCNFPWRRCLWGSEGIYKRLCFSHLSLCCWFW